MSKDYQDSVEYIGLRRYLDSPLRIDPEIKEWGARTLMHDYFPSLESRLADEYHLNGSERDLCMLVICGYRTSDICSLWNRKLSAISQSKRRIKDKMGLKGTDKRILPQFLASLIENRL